MNSVPTNFWQWVAELDSGERTGLMVVSMWVVFFIVSTVLFTVYKMHKNRLEDSLKRELLDRGMTADEIVAIVRARPTRRVARENRLLSPIRSELS